MDALIGFIVIALIIWFLIGESALWEASADFRKKYPEANRRMEVEVAAEQSLYELEYQTQMDGSSELVYVRRPPMRRDETGMPNPNGIYFY